MGALPPEFTTRYQNLTKDKLEKRLRKVVKELKEMGNVNRNAVEELEMLTKDRDSCREKIEVIQQCTQVGKTNDILKQENLLSSIFKRNHFMSQTLKILSSS